MRLAVIILGAALIAFAFVKFFRGLTRIKPTANPPTSGGGQDNNPGFGP